MKKLLLGTIFLVWAVVVPVPAMAGVNINIGIALPPPIVFGGPPAVIVLPDTDDVYVVPDIDIDLFFWNGWWWRLWEGRWYRSRYYNRAWVYYDYIPSFYFDVDPGWRVFYREHAWHGHRWNYERIPDRRLRQNWRSWHTNRYWERQGTWGVRSYQPRLQPQRQELRQQRQLEYQRRPEVQRHQRQRQEQQRQLRVRQPQRQERPQQQHFQPRGEQRQGESRHQKSQGRPEREEGEHRR
jgi:hypothetical protein